jgi:hypothetical protein
MPGVLKVNNSESVLVHMLLQCVATGLVWLASRMGEGWMTSQMLPSAVPTCHREWVFACAFYIRYNIG